MPLPRGCKIREIDTGAKNCFQFQLDCQGVVFPEPFRSMGTGMIKACRHKRRGRVVYNVERLFVQESMQRRGFATALYERAAQEACKRRGRLASLARQRGSHSFDFWQKQLQKGRAEYHPLPVHPNMISPTYDREYWRRSQDVFILKNCDQPIDLSSIFAKPAWVR